MDIQQYQPSAQILHLANLFCDYFNQSPNYYNLDLGNRIFVETSIYPITGVVDITPQRIERLQASHMTGQLVTVVDELLKLFPNMRYVSDECDGLLSLLCNGRAIEMTTAKGLCRGIVTLRGVVWLDRFDHDYLNPDAVHYEEMARLINVHLALIKFQGTILKRFL